MTTDDFKRQAVRLVDGYLNGAESRDAVWRWAEGGMLSKEWDELPMDMQDDIHGLWLLHDKDESWVPDIDEIRRIRNNLAKQLGE
jgi:hypothetical protein